MLTEWANHIVIAALGLGIGMLTQATAIVAPPEFKEVVRSRIRGEGIFRATMRRSEEQAAIVGRSPRLQRVSLAQVALVFVLAAVVALSPVELGWWTLVASFTAGVVLVEGVHQLARRGALRPGGALSSFDPLRGAEIAAARAPERKTATERQRLERPP